MRESELIKSLRSVRQFSQRQIPDDVWLVMRDDDVATLMDEGRLMQNLMLGAWAHGVGSCIASIYPKDNQQRARELLGIPPDRHLRTMLSIGYPAGPQALRLPENAPIPRGRRPLAEVVSWERFGTARA